MSTYQFIYLIRKHTSFAGHFAVQQCIALISSYWLVVNNKPLAYTVTASREALKDGERLRYTKLL